MQHAGVRAGVTSLAGQYHGAIKAAHQAAQQAGRAASGIQAALAGSGSVHNELGVVPAPSIDRSFRWAERRLVSWKLSSCLCSFGQAAQPLCMLQIRSEGPPVVLHANKGVQPNSALVAACSSSKFLCTDILAACVKVGSLL